MDKFWQRHSLMALWWRKTSNLQSVRDRISINIPMLGLSHNHHYLCLRQRFDCLPQRLSASVVKDWVYLLYVSRPNQLPCVADGWGQAGVCAWHCDKTGEGHRRVVKCQETEISGMLPGPVPGPGQVFVISEKSVICHRNDPAQSCQDGLDPGWCQNTHNLSFSEEQISVWKSSAFG